MNHKAARLRKSLIALVTLVRLLSAMDPQVSVQTADVSEGLVADLKRNLNYKQIK